MLRLRGGGELGGKREGIVDSGVGQVGVQVGDGALQGLHKRAKGGSGNYTQEPEWGKRLVGVRRGHDVT